MAVGLFRREAIDHQRFRIWGEVTLSLPRSYALVTGFIAVSVLAMALFIATQSSARKKHAAGFLVPTEGIARIIPPRDGTITEVHVSEGQHVERGAPLLTVTNAETSDRGEDIDYAKADRLRAQRDLLREQILPERQKSDAEAQRLQSQIDGALAEITALARQQTIQRERIEIARQQLAGAVELAGKGYLSRVEMRRRQDAHLAEIQSESSLAKEFAGKQSGLSQLRNELQQLAIKTAQRVAQLEASIAELDVHLKELEARRAICCRHRSRGEYPLCRPGSASSPTQRFPLCRSCLTAMFWRPSCSYRRGPSASSIPVRASTSATIRFHSSSSASRGAAFAQSRAHF